MSTRRRAGRAGTPRPAERRGAPRDAANTPPAGPAARNRYVDLVRLAAILVVVVGHWLDTTIVIERGMPVGQSALAVVGYTRWFTLLLQVMPMFFLAGGYAAAAAWPSWRARGGRWPGWVHSRLLRLLRPTSWFVALLAGVAAVALMLGLDPSVLGQTGWGVALQLWFLPVYLLLIVLAVPMLAAWNRAGWLLLALLVVGVAVVDVLVQVAQVSAAGWASYLMAPAAGFVLGIAWRAGALARRAVAIGMVTGGVLALAAMVTLLDYPPWMIGVPGERFSNTGPPNLALMAYAAAQTGVVLLLEAPLGRWLSRPRVWVAVARGNAVVMTLYLWHMVPVVVIAAAAYAADLLPGPRAGTPQWWELRILWVGVLALVLAGVVGIVGRFERPSPPRPGLTGWATSALLLACAGLTGYALSRLALGGFAPTGDLAVGPLAIYAAGMLALWLAPRVGSDARTGAPASTPT